MEQNKTKKFRLVVNALIVVALAVNIALLYFVKAEIGLAGSDELHIVFLTAPECENCFDLEPFKEFFKQNDVSEEQFSEYDYDSFSGRKLVKKYEITRVPTVIVSGNVYSYSFMSDLLDNIGEMRKNSFVVTRLQPPYIDIETEEVRGLFDVIYLDDTSCEDCYDVKLNDDVFERLGLFHPENQTEIDITDKQGQLLIEVYGIEAIPTVILKGDLDAYDSLLDIWSQVGTVEDDGVYILRKGVASMGVYKQLPDGNIIQQQEIDENLLLE